MPVFRGLGIGKEVMDPLQGGEQVHEGVVPQPGAGRGRCRGRSRRPGSGGLCSQGMQSSRSDRHDSRGGGIPEGHPALNAFLGMPFHIGQRLAGMIGIADRPGASGGSSAEVAAPRVRNHGIAKGHSATGLNDLASKR